jgi:putative hemolysin
VNGVGLQLTLVAFLVLLNAAFAGSEIALISLRESGGLPGRQRSSSSRSR